MTGVLGRNAAAAAGRGGASGSGTVLLVSANADLRTRLAEALRGLRWAVQEAESGAEAWLRQEERPSGAVLLDEWLPDLSAREFGQQFLQQFPTVDLLSTSGAPHAAAVRCGRRNELLLALRDAEEAMLPASGGGGAQGGGGATPGYAAAGRERAGVELDDAREEGGAAAFADEPVGAQSLRGPADGRPAAEVVQNASAEPVFALPEMVGASPALRELARLVRLAAPHAASILIEGETGTGKELVARAVHRLSPRASKPFMTLNCAAIPEQLLEAELFGHTRGAFTGAVTSRTGRIEAAHGGTLFLDEIGEMPLPLQAKMLRFLECGEIQRIGDNETLRVDVRIVSATHQPLEENAEEGRFRLDLFHRLAVFPVVLPALRDRMEDVPMLVQYTLERLGQDAPRRSMHPAALARLMEYAWPGNVRELLHVLQRAVILSGDAPEIRPEHILLRTRKR